MITRLRELALKATPGPWNFYDGKQDGPSDFVYPQQVTSLEPSGCDEEDYTHYQICSMPNDSYEYASNFHDNGAFIAACSPDHILKLLDNLDQMKEALEQYKDYAIAKDYGAPNPPVPIFVAKEALAKLKEIT